MIETQAIASTGEILDHATVQQTLHTGLEDRYKGKRVLVLIPDHTRTIPLPNLFRTLVAALHNTRQLDFMVALGTHPPHTQESLDRLVGITAEERGGRYSHIRFFNHDWEDRAGLMQIAILSNSQVKEIAGDNWHPTLPGDVPVRINRRILDYDQILILGPTFPHEVVGFSGGVKYLFPGISGPEMIHATHWLGALVGVMDTIGEKHTPMRAMIHAAAEHVPRPVTLISVVVVDGDLAGIFIGDPISAWEAAADLSAQRHIKWFDKPFQRVLSWAPSMYDELWTAGKAMYKLEPVVADGGEVIIYAPHLQVVSRMHGDYLFEVGYHVLDYFLKQWDRFDQVPLGVLAHSTHVRGAGRYEEGQEQSRVKVILSSRIPREDCQRLSLGYLNPAEVDITQWQGRESEGILFVPKAGEILYRLGD